MNVTRSRVTFLERKVMNVIDLLELYDKYSRAVDPMDSWLMELDIGELSLQEAKFKMRQALILQKQVEQAWMAYHKDHGSLLSPDVIRNPLIISHRNPNFVLNPTLDMEQVREKPFISHVAAYKDPPFNSGAKQPSISAL